MDFLGIFKISGLMRSNCKYSWLRSSLEESSFVTRSLLIVLASLFFGFRSWPASSWQAVPYSQANELASRPTGVKLVSAVAVLAADYGRVTNDWLSKPVVRDEYLLCAWGQHTGPWLAPSQPSQGPVVWPRGPQTLQGVCQEFCRLAVSATARLHLTYIFAFSQISQILPSSLIFSIFQISHLGPNSARQWISRIGQICHNSGISQSQSNPLI